MSTLSYDNIIQNGIVADGDKLMHDLDQIKGIINNNIDFDNLKDTLMNAASGLVKLDDLGDVPLDQIPDVLTGKDADTLDGDELTDIETTMDTKDIAVVAAHKAVASAHHTKTTNASELSSGTIPLARIPSALTGKTAQHALYS